jgi:hypothetical protein
MDDLIIFRENAERHFALWDSYCRWYASSDEQIEEEVELAVDALEAGLLL